MVEIESEIRNELENGIEVESRTGINRIHKARMGLERTMELKLKSRTWPRSENDMNERRLICDLGDKGFPTSLLFHGEAWRTYGLHHKLFRLGQCWLEAANDYCHQYDGFVWHLRIQVFSKA
ncbi:hypothetical protein EVAR_75439_1 [Eumeta japonica]|uniref:Uncharacterized protein n=1 Tax=Eumeta variegata TaxID=151549 RepID=A0A4C1TLC4_EUMVA|nr:hypothetical protein EVAR_75439_1 [Eumeta japonica]